MDNFVGEIRLFGGNFAPAGWALCNGAILSISQYDTLFALIGTTYGGDGQNTFALPDLRARIPVGQGQGPGLTNRVMGEQFGVAEVTLLQNDMPAHTHDLRASTSAATASQPAPDLVPAQNGTDNFYLPKPGSGALPQSMKPNSVTPSGSTLPHSNIMRSTAVNYIIALYGVFPSSN
ncbi:phage tail protein [Delftia acidovorans]